MSETITIKFTLSDGSSGMTKISDGVAIGKFTNSSIARRLYELGKKQGKLVEYDKRTDAYIEKYPGKSSGEISIILGNELKQAGGKIK